MTKYYHKLKPHTAVDAPISPPIGNVHLRQSEYQAP